MKPLSMIRRKTPLVIASAILILIWYKFRGSAKEEKPIPVLRKVFAHAGTAVIYGPFTSETYGEPESDHSISLVTHTSLKNLYHLQIIGMVWKSPISVAIWAHGDISRVIELAYILTGPCAGRQSLSISIVVPNSVTHNVDINIIDYDEILYPSSTTCSQRTLHNRFYELRTLDPESNYASQELPYPNNYLRNMALARVRTSHALVIDIDILPSINLDELFMSFTHSNPVMAKSETYAFVVPVFESEKVRINQWSIERLKEELQIGRVRQFYGKLCPQCQGATQYTNWIERQKTNGDKSVQAHQVPYIPGWEPFVIIRTDSHPKYDERFKQFGYNRMSGICELYMSGRTFHVLDQVFLVHDGFKEEEGFHADKDRELNSNALLYQDFMTELAQKYDTKRRC